MPSAEAGHLPTTLYMPSGAARWPLCHPTMMAPEHHRPGKVIVQCTNGRASNTQTFTCICANVYLCFHIESMGMSYCLAFSVFYDYALSFCILYEPLECNCSCQGNCKKKEKSYFLFKSLEKD